MKKILIVACVAVIAACNSKNEPAKVQAMKTGFLSGQGRSQPTLRENELPANCKKHGDSTKTEKPIWLINTNRSRPKCHPCLQIKNNKLPAPILGAFLKPVKPIAPYFILSSVSN